MGEYIKNYNPGNIMMDLPYNSHIHELPLLSFKDFRNSVNISLIFNRKLKIEGDNSFNVGEGYKLNIHKRIIFQNNIPVKLMESNGKYVLLNRNKNSENSTTYNNVYTFDDDSQRVLRVKLENNEETNQLETYYEVEHADLSREVYNSLGYLQYVYDKYDDKYLEYIYENNLLKEVKYANNNNYIVSFGYYNSVLTSISYGGTTTALVYNNPDLTVSHYSGVTYVITVTNTKFTVKARGTEDTGLYYKTKECSYSGNNITLTYKEGTTEIDRLLYTFPSSVTGNCQSYDYVYITNKNNVKERIQFNGDKPLYSYEVDYDYDEVQFYNDKCTSDVTIHNTLNVPHPNLFNGIIKYNSGMVIPKKMYYNNKWEIQVRNDLETTDTFLLTGWAKSGSIGSTNEISIGYALAESCVEHRFNIPISKENQWHFFAYQFDINAKYVVVSNSSNLDIKDLRIMYRATDISEVKNNAFVSLKEDILIDNTSNASLLFKEVTFKYETETGDTGELNLTFSDVLRYMKKKNRDAGFNELYHENCKKVITDILWFRVYVNETGTYKGIDNYGVGYLQYRNGKQYDTRIQKYGDTSMFNISNNKDKSYYSSQIFNEYFDVEEDHHDGIDTYYTRDKGLILNENQTTNYNITYTYNTTNNTLVVNDSYNNYFMSSDVTYYMDPVWGTMYKKQMTNGTKIEDTYDDDMSVILEKEFNKQTLGIRHLFGYSKGNLTSLSCDTLNYTFAYSKEKLSQVTKFSSTIEELVHTDTTSTFYYPSQANSIYSEQYVYDKYNRVKSITNVLENTYNAFSEFNESTGVPNENFDTNNSKLVMFEDKIKSQKSRFHYNPEGTLSKVEVTKATDYSNKISNETFTYDDANRLLSKEFVYNPSSNGKVNDEFTYVKSADNPNLDEVIKTSKYSINGVKIVDTINSYSFKKINGKTYKFGTKSVSKDLDYTNNKVSNETSNIFGTSSSITYTYDTFDRLSSITSNGKKITFEYDIYNRLIRENNQQLDKTIIYDYNDIGNIVTNTTYAYTVATNPATLRSSKTYSYDSNIKDRLISFNDTTISYNTLGCPTTYNGYNLTWNKGKLTGMSKGSLELGTESYSYSYNALGQRVSKTYYRMQGTNPITPIYSGDLLSIDKKYYYDNSGRLIREANTYGYQGGSSTNEIVEYIYDVNNIIGIRYTKGTTTNVYYFDRNIFGDVVGIYDTSGVLKVKYLYDAYGNCTVSSETTDTNLAQINPIRYRGYYYDVETGLFWLSSRYYSPELCRFISPDSVDYLDPSSINGLNLYAYCNNDPINYADPSGHVAISIGLLLAIGGIVGAVIGAGASVAGQYLANGCSWENFSWGQLALDTVLGGVSGMLSMSPLGWGTMIAANAGIGFVGAVGGHLINGSDFSKLSTWVDIGLSTGLGALVGVVGGPGALNAGYLNGAKQTAGFIRAAGLYDDVLTKAVTGFYRTPGIASNALRLSGQNLVKQWNKMVVSQAGKALTKALAYGGTALLIGTAGKGWLYDLYNDYF